MENSNDVQTPEQKTIDQQSVTKEAAQRGVQKDVKVSAISVDKVYKGNYDGKGMETAQLRQTVTTDAVYPKKQIANNMQDNIFGQDEFQGLETAEYSNTEQRVGWIQVPEGTTAEQVAERLKKFPDARLYKVLSNKPVISDSQAAAIKNNITSLEVIAERQVVRFSPGHELEGKIVPDPAGKIQYRSIFFSDSGKADEDRRNGNPEDYWASEKLNAELLKQTDITSVADVVGGQKM